MSDAPLREWRFYIDDMIGFSGKVMAYTHGLDQAAFVASGLNYDATVRSLELISEAEPICRTPCAWPARRFRGVSSSPPATG